MVQGRQLFMGQLTRERECTTESNDINDSDKTFSESESYGTMENPADKSEWKQGEDKDANYVNHMNKCAKETLLISKYSANVNPIKLSP